MTAEEKVKEIIIKKYGSIVAFSRATGLPNSTIVNVLSRGFNKSGVDNVIVICRELKISVDALAEGKIERVSYTNKQEPDRRDVGEMIAEIKDLCKTDGELLFNGKPLTAEERKSLLSLLTYAIKFREISEDN